MSQVRPNPKRRSIYQMITAIWQSMAPGVPSDRNLDRMLVRSSSIVAVGYKQASLTLQVEYFSGWVYEASGVPKALYKKLAQADDFDAVFRNHIRFQYPMDRVGRLLPVFAG